MRQQQICSSIKAATVVAALLFGRRGSWRGSAGVFVLFGRQQRICLSSSQNITAAEKSVELVV